MIKYEAIFGVYRQATGDELWISDGSTGGTRLLKETIAGSSSGLSGNTFAIGGGKALFSVYDGTAVGPQPWITDGTAAGTHRLTDSIAFSKVGTPVRMGDGKALFSADDGVHGVELWTTDGTAAGTRIISDFSAPNPDVGALAFLDGIAFFDAYASTNGPYRLASTNGVDGHVSFAQLANGQPISADSFAALGHGEIVFAGTSGSSFGLYSISDQDPFFVPTLIRSSRVASLTDLGNGSAVFLGYSGNHSGLWTTDGSVDGTSVLVNDVFPEQIIALGNGTALFATYVAGVNSQQLWTTDGTFLGTHAVSTSGIGPSSITPIGNGRAVMTGYDADHGIELWVTDIPRHAGVHFA